MNAIRDFVEHLEGAGKSSHTVRAYQSDLRGFEKWFGETNGGEPTLEGITPIDVRDYRSHLITRRLKPATVNRRLASMSAFCSWAVKQELIPSNPAEDIRKVGELRAAPKWLDKREQNALIRAVREKGSLRDIALITFMLHTGLRVGEVANLKLEDIEIRPRSGEVQVRNGKGGQDRVVDLNVDARKALNAYLGKRLENGSGSVFLGQRGKLNEPGIHYLTVDYARRAKLEKVTPHTLRHTFGKSLRDEGVELEVIAHLMGHRSLSTTALYTTPSRQDLQRAVERMAWC